MDTSIIISLSVAGLAFAGTVTHAIIRREKKRSIPPPAPLIGSIETNSSNTATGSFAAPVGRDYCDSRHNNVGLRHDAVLRRLDEHDEQIKELHRTDEQLARQVAYIAKVSRAINHRMNLRVSSDMLEDEDK